MTAERLTQSDLVCLIRHHAALARACKLSALASTERAWERYDDNLADVSRSPAIDWKHFNERRGMVRAFSMVLALMRRRKVSEIGAEKDTWKASDLDRGKDAIYRAKSLMPGWPNRLCPTDYTRE